MPRLAQQYRGVDVLRTIQGQPAHRDDHEQWSCLEPFDRPPECGRDLRRDGHAEGGVFAPAVADARTPLCVRRLPTLGNRRTPSRAPRTIWFARCPLVWAVAHVALGTIREHPIAIHHSTQRGPCDIVASAHEQLGAEPQRPFRSRARQASIASRSAGAGGRRSRLIAAWASAHATSWLRTHVLNLRAETGATPPGAWATGRPRVLRGEGSLLSQHRCSTCAASLFFGP